MVDHGINHVSAQDFLSMDSAWLGKALTTLSSAWVKLFTLPRSRKDSSAKEDTKGNLAEQVSASATLMAELTVHKIL